MERGQYFPLYFQSIPCFRQSQAMGSTRQDHDDHALQDHSNYLLVRVVPRSPYKEGGPGPLTEFGYGPRALGPLFSQVRQGDYLRWSRVVPVVPDHRA